MRADRLLSILLLLQVNTRLTARALAERLEVSERTILRDMEALGAAGVPVTAQRGAGGGWGLVQGYRSDLTGLNAAETRTLFLTKSSRLFADLGMKQAAEAALIKLLASLSAGARRDVEHTRERLHIDGAGWYQSGEAFPLLPVLQEAVWQERQVLINYQRADGTTLERLVHPLGLVAKGGIWYLVAGTEGRLRSYRVSRVQGAGITDTPCVRPPGFDLAAFWEQSVAELKAGVPRYPAVLRVAPELLTRVRSSRSLQIEREAATDENGWTTLSVMFEVEGEARDFVLRAGTLVEALEPDALRKSVRQFAEGIASLYGPLTQG
jgi:predicted DNA-binding transcriptional regulator YafY